MKRLLYLGLILSLIVASSAFVYADPGAQMTIDSISLSSDQQWILVQVTVQPKPNGGLSGQVLLSLDSSFLSKGGLQLFDSETTVVLTDGSMVSYVFTVPFQGVGHYKFVATAFSYPSLELIGFAVADPPAVGTRR